METKEARETVRQLIDQINSSREIGGLPEVQAVLQRICAILEALTADVTFLKEGEEADMVSYHQ